MKKKIVILGVTGTVGSIGGVISLRILNMQFVLNHDGIISAINLYFAGQN